MKNHIAALVCAIIAGIIIAMPTYLSILSLGDKYAGMPYIYQDSEDVYIARMKEIVEGNTSISQPYFYEGKELSSAQTPYGEMLYAYPAIFLNLPVEDVFHFSKFLLPFLLFLLVYFFCLMLVSRNKKLFALACSFAVMFLYEFSSPHYLYNFLTFKEQGFFLNIWGRSVNPITGAILLFLILNIFEYFGFCKSKNKVYSYLPFVLVGVIFGISSGYFFSFGFLAVILGLQTLVFCIKKQWDLFFKYCTTIMIGLAINYQYFLNIALAILNKSASGTPITKNGLFYTHEPVSNTFIFLAVSCIVFLFFLSTRYKSSFSHLQEPRTKLSLLMLFNLAGLICLNQQIITGIAIWPAHFVQYTLPFVFITLIYTVYVFTIPYPRIQRIVLISVILVGFVVGLRDGFSYKHNLEKFANFQKYSPLAKYLNSEIKACTVLFSDKYDYASRFIPTITKCNVYTSHYTFFNVSDESIYHRYLAYLYINGVKSEDLDSHWKVNREEVRVVFFRDWGDYLYNPNYTWLLKVANHKDTDEYFHSLEAKIKKDYKIVSEYSLDQFLIYLSKYHITHIIFDKHISKFFNSSNIKKMNSSGMEVSFENGNFQIWKIK